MIKSRSSGLPEILTVPHVNSDYFFTAKESCHYHGRFPEGPSTQYLRSVVPKTIPLRNGFGDQSLQILGTWTLWVLHRFPIGVHKNTPSK